VWWGGNRGGFRQSFARDREKLGLMEKSKYGFPVLLFLFWETI